ncbi:hypothetical protein BLOT_008247 [Blomia tropicalis]|nr:hypothetical protein BLOT_008247 [Blomia tropicalis]
MKTYICILIFACAVALTAAADEAPKEPVTKESLLERLSKMKDMIEKKIAELNANGQAGELLQQLQSLLTKTNEAETQAKIAVKGVSQIVKQLENRVKNVATPATTPAPAAAKPEAPALD